MQATQDRLFEALGEAYVQRILHTEYLEYLGLIKGVLIIVFFSV